MQDDLQGLGVRSEDDHISGSSVQRLGRLVGTLAQLLIVRGLLNQVQDLSGHVGLRQREGFLVYCFVGHCPFTNRSLGDGSLVFQVTLYMLLCSRLRRSLPVLKLREGFQSNRISHQPLIYSNEVSNGPDLLNELRDSAGLVRVSDFSDVDLGIALYNHNSLTRGRLLGAGIESDSASLRKVFAFRIKKALDLRNELFSRPYYRLLSGEEDGLPGLEVDRYDDVLVMRFSAPQMARLSLTVLEALVDVLNPKVVITSNLNHQRRLEGLPFERPYLSLDRRPVSHPSVLVSIALLDPMRSLQVDLLATDFPMNYSLLSRVLTSQSSMKSVLDLNTRFGLSALLLPSTRGLATHSSASVCEQTRSNLELMNEWQVKHSSSQDSYDMYEFVVVNVPWHWQLFKSTGRNRRTRELLNKAVRSVEEGGTVIVSGFTCVREIMAETAVSLGKRAYATTLAKSGEEYVGAFTIRNW